MPMPPYAVRCQGCGQPAAYKIAARWSDGVTGELKTYALCCAGCLATLWQQSLEKRAACLLAPGETLDAPGIYELSRGCRDVRLCRRSDLEGIASVPSAS
ncbi:MAG: hypothetical protein K2W96_06470 [Gemmataceae bacterium]|nr:hypothetical protein [Gemmataceae bacterium]